MADRIFPRRTRRDEAPTVGFFADRPGLDAPPTSEIQERELIRLVGENADLRGQVATLEEQMRGILDQLDEARGQTERLRPFAMPRYRADGTVPDADPPKVPAAVHEELTRSLALLGPVDDDDEALSGTRGTGENTPPAVSA